MGDDTKSTSIQANHQVTLGPDGPAVGRLAYGCWRLATEGATEARQKIEAALDLGMNLIDTADIYGIDTVGFGGAEELLGEVFRDAPDLRDQMVLATKGGITPPVPYDSSAEYLNGALEASLRRMGVESVDLYQVHRPDVLTSPAELADTLDNMVASGRVRYIGVSNYSPSQTAALMAHLDTDLVSTQPEFSLARLDPIYDGTLDQCAALSLLPLAWSPLGGGQLMHPLSDRDHAIVSLLNELATTHGVTPSAVALAFLLAHPAGVIAIVGTQKRERMVSASAALDVNLTPSQWYALYETALGEPLP